MAIITYAQNFEDVLLDRIFGGKRRGFYVDVGAAHPDLLSVTKHFYNLGWHGINIEPNPELYAVLAAGRPRDINLCLAAGAKFDVRTFFQASVAEASSFDQEMAQKQTKDAAPKSFMVEIRTLSEICRQFCEEPIDFLKIDVEGFEREVLEGADFDRFRPVVVVLESIKPFGGCTWKTVQEVMNSSLWSDVLERNGYQFAYFDGLNSFFLRKEDQELRAVFSIPVSFRDFILPIHPFLDSSQLSLLPPAQAEIYRQFTNIKRVVTGQSKDFEEYRVSNSRMLDELKELKAGEMARQKALHVEELEALKALKSKEMDEQKALHVEELEALKALKNKEMDELTSSHLKELENRETSTTKEIENIEQRNNKKLEELKACKDAEIANLNEQSRRTSLLIDALKNDVASLKQKRTELQQHLDEQRDFTTGLQKKASEQNSRLAALRENVNEQEKLIADLQQRTSEQNELVNFLQGKLTWNRGEVGRLRKAGEADRQTILKLDARARSLAMSMHAREECIPNWLRPFLPKWALPTIGEPIKLNASPAPKTISGSVKPPAPKPKTSNRLPMPPAEKTAAAPVASTAVSVSRLPGSLERYPDRTGRRLAEGGRRLKGEKRASRPGEPLVTIVTTVRNGEKHLEQAMQSVFAQTYPNIEYIIVDGASTDGTLDLIKRHESKIDYYISEPDSGIYAGMNKGIELARGEYILVLNADDWYVPEAVEKLVRHAESTQADLTAADSRNIDENGQDVPPSPTSGLSRSSWTPMAYIVCPLKHEITLVHKNIYIRYGLYDESLRICADWKWMAEIYDGGRCRVDLLHEPLLVFRIGGASSSAEDVAHHWHERCSVSAMFFPEVDERDLSHALKLSLPKGKEARQLKLKYPASDKLHRILDIRYQGWRFATRVSDEDFNPLEPLFVSDVTVPRTELSGVDGSRSTSYPGRYLRYPDRTGQRLAEGGRRLRGEYPFSRQDAPLVSVVTTVRNGAKHLKQAIESVFSQAYRNIEYIVVDGASTDGTLDLLRRYDGKIDYFVSEPDTGIYAGMNKGIELARGDFILILNADDYLASPDAVALLVKQNKGNAVAAVLGGARRLDASDRQVGVMRSRVDARLFLRCTVVHEAMLASKELYERFGLYDESFKVVGDWAWMRRVLPQIPCRVVDEDILAHRSIGVSARDDIETAREKHRLVASDVPDLSWEDYYPARYPHHLTRAASDALAAKYPKSAAFVAALAFFPEEEQSETKVVSCSALMVGDNSRGGGVISDAAGDVLEVDSFDPISYWKKRHNDFRADSRAVGAVMLSREENDRIYDDFNRWLAEFLRQLFQPEAGRIQRVLDVGCGTGMNAPVFLESGWEYCGMDVSETAIEQARIRAPGGEYKLHDLSSSPLPEWEKRFDCVFIRTVLIHVVDDDRWRALLHHAAKLLRETGKFMILDAFPDQRQSPARHVVVRSLDEYRAVAASLDMALDFHARNGGGCVVISRQETR